MRILTLEIRLEGDVVLTRQRPREIAGLLGFPLLDQTRVATAVSEIARNAYQHAGGGTVEFLVDLAVPQRLLIRVHERGPGIGIENLQALLDGRPIATAPMGMGTGIVGARRLMDRFEIAGTPGGGATITLAKGLPRRAASLAAADLGRLATELARHAPQGLLDELQHQNQELIRTLQELRDRQSEVTELHRRELEETNRGVVALYAELDDNARALKRISELKSRFLSNMSHEFRSPLNTILSLTKFLLDRSDGELTAEQEKQVGFIRKAADGLSGLVNDLLDLAKVEAGKAVVRPRSFEAADLFEGLRGTIRPLMIRDAVKLEFDEPAGIGTLRTDEAKVGQILRNFLTNAVKYTECGSIRLGATSGPDDTVIFTVADTGIGIAPEDRERIFEEFGQIEGPLQGVIKGTGLGLPLSRKLAELLGGSVMVQSEPEVGSTFFAVIPRLFREPGAVEVEVEVEVEAKLEPVPQLTLPRRPAGLPVLVVEDNPVDLLLYQQILDGSSFQVRLARTLDEARRALRRVRPAAVLLDIRLEGDGGWTLLSELKGAEATREIPVLVLTEAGARDEAPALGADDFSLKPVEPSWLLDRLERLAHPGRVATVLIIDDQQGDRRALKDLLDTSGTYRILEAGSGLEGLQRAREANPDVIFLDLVMPDMNGLEVLERLKADDATRAIPVIINSSKALGDDERRRLGAGTVAILDKSAGPGHVRSRTIRETLLKAGLGGGSDPDPESESAASAPASTGPGPESRP